MAEAQEQGGTNRFMKDLPGRFILGNHFLKNVTEVSDEGEEEVELSLGLSLNGRFGVDPKRARKLNLTRSSSISDFMLTKDDENKSNSGGLARLAPPVAHVPLIRACSLPTETEEEWRKRKEIQSLRRMEAKRKRLEKLKNARTLRDQACLEANFQENVKAHSNGFRAGVGGAHGSESKGSMGSQGSGSSGISESDNQPAQETNNRSTEAKSPSSIQSHMPAATLLTNEKLPKTFESPMDDPPRHNSNSNSKAEETMRNMMLDMPCVSTRGVGPNGKRVEGFLYRYRKGEEVRIVCVCHGSFLSPAEFVKHAGGGDVDHPLKHIVVSPSSLL
ncbi:hypothetical protein NMG60_11006349 [Bertholletia excelsa]